MLNVSHSLEKILAFEFTNADISGNTYTTYNIFPFYLNLKERVYYKASP